MQVLKEKIILNFIEDNRWMYLVDGLKATMTITVFAVMIGILLGFIVAVVCKVYLTVIRGTPVVVQLLIIYFVIFGSVNIDQILVAILAFGFNSGAYVAEIIRSGIMSIDNGQFEAGRSLGFNYPQTMCFRHWRMSLLYY